MAEIKNLKKTAERIIRAVKNREKIILYGDADFDGAASVIILKESIEILLSKLPEKARKSFPPIDVYFPDRTLEGYGMNRAALKILKNKSPALLITLDCGISNFEEIKEAKKLGFKVIVIDHHEILKRIPEAEIVVDPLQKTDKYPFKKFSNTGITFKLSIALLGRKMEKTIRKSFLELTALATLADMMPQKDENKLFIDEGLDSLKDTKRPGLKVFLEIFDEDRILSQRIVSAVNTSKVKNHIFEGYLLLTADSEKKAKKFAKIFTDRIPKRRQKIKRVVECIQKRLPEKSSDSVIIFEGSPSWSLFVLGAAASRICRNYKLPAFLFSMGKKKSQGTVRVPHNLDSIKAMSSCSYLLKTFGGHQVASGFAIENKNLKKFKDCLIEYFKKQ